MFVESNRIPAEPIVEVILAYLGSEGDRVGDGSYSPLSLYVLAERADIKADTLDKILHGRTRTIDFNVADNILGAMNMHDLWSTDLLPLYEKAVFDEGWGRHKVESASGTKFCARRGCSVRFIPHPRCPRQKFCSSTCCAASWRQEKIGIKTQLRGKGNALQKLICRNGHERTNENTTIDSRGKRVCLICKRKTDRASAKRRYEARLALD